MERSRIGSLKGSACSRASLALAAALLLASTSAAQTREPLDQAFERWQAEHGPNWRMVPDAGTGAAAFLHGDTLPAPFAPRSDAQWFALARTVLAQSAALHAIEPETLVEDRALFLPLGMVGSSDKMTVRFSQAVHGVPVEYGSVNVLFDARGGLLSVQARALPEVADFPVVPALEAGSAVVGALAEFTADTGLEGVLLGLPELVVAQLQQEERRVPRLVYKATVQWTAAGAAPEGYTYFVDANTGEIAHRERSVYNVDVGGTVSTMSTPGVYPDSASNPEVPFLMKYARVQSSAGTVFTDANGDFVFPGVSGPLQCTFTYVGTYNDVRNSSGPAYSLQASLTGTGNAVLLNPSSADLTTSQSNVFVQINTLRDWIKSVNPLDTVPDFVYTANANVGGSCNAFFTGSSIDFLSAGGTCPNMAYTTIIAHEAGHWLNVRYNIGNNFDGMGEGSADTWALLCYDDQFVGRDFFAVGQHLRDGEGTRQFCGDCCPACNGGFHNDGEVFMGANWKTRRNLVNSLGVGPGDAIADALFIGWHNAYDQFEIKSVIETQYLTLDDIDGNINNGTPHFQQIDDAFREQGFPGVQFVPIQVTATPVGDTVDEVGPYAVAANAVSNIGATITSMTLHHRVGWTGAFTPVAMTSSGGGNWTASIAGQPSPTRVFYYFTAADSLGNNSTFPSGGASDARFFSIGTASAALLDDFETDKGWVASPGNNMGAWVRDDPIGSLNGPAQAQPEDDNPNGTGTRCYVTGQGPVGGNPDLNDVDLGPRNLTTPPLALIYGNGEVRYSYWVYTSAGDDSLVVELSTNGTSWTTAKTYSGGIGGWKDDKLDVGSYLTPGPTTYVRFRISDNPNNSITEAAIDDVRVSTLLSSGCALPTTYCTPKIDSSFCIPRVSSVGYASLGGTDPFTISMANASGQRNGLLFYGYGTQAVPFQGGLKCVTSPQRRTPVQSTGGTLFACNGAMSFDFGTHARSGADPLLIPGQAVGAQFFYRDPFDPFQTALSDAVSFTICP